jgi:hypothetical protein
VQNRNDNHVRRLNYVDASIGKKLDLSPDSVPTLVPASIMSKWQEGDTNPYYKLQMIEYPIVANRLTYEESFFESFVNKLKDRPIPGSKNGHGLGFGERQPTDLLLVGGRLEKNGDGSGRVFLKNYIPKSGESGSNEVFIRENESDMIHFSLVSYPREIVENDADGTTKIRIVESMFGERNDAVEYGTGAMKQITNQTAGVADGNNNNREQNMDKDEILRRLKNLKASGDVTLPEIAGTFDQAELLVTDDHREALKVYNGLKEINVTDPVAEIVRLRAQHKDSAAAVRNAKITEKFGAPDPDADGNERNLLREYAVGKIGEADGEELDRLVNVVKEDPIAKRLAGDQADPTSEENHIGVVEDRNGVQNKNSEASGRRTDRL